MSFYGLWRKETVKAFLTLYVKDISWENRPSSTTTYISFYSIPMSTLGGSIKSQRTWFKCWCSWPLNSWYLEKLVGLPTDRSPVASDLDLTWVRRPPWAQLPDKVSTRGCCNIFDVDVFRSRLPPPNAVCDVVEFDDDDTPNSSKKGAWEFSASFGKSSPELI